MRTSRAQSTLAIACGDCLDRHVVPVVHATIVWEDGVFHMAYRCPTTGGTAYKAMTPRNAEVIARAVPVLLDPDVRVHLNGANL